MIAGFVRGQTLRLSVPRIAADTIDYLTAKFLFQSSDWDGLEKWAHFAKSGAAYDIRLTDDEITADAHLNLSAGKWRVYLHGNRYANGAVVQRVTTDAQELEVLPTGILNGEPFPTVPPSAGEQIIASAAAAEAGAKSAADEAGRAAESAKESADLAKKSAEITGNAEQIIQDALRDAKESGEFDGEDGITPHIGANGNWFVGETDTGIRAQGKDGAKGDPGDDYTLTAEDKQEIAGLIPGGGNVGNVLILVGGTSLDSLRIEIVAPPAGVSVDAAYELIGRGLFDVAVQTYSDDGNDLTGVGLLRGMPVGDAVGAIGEFWAHGNVSLVNVTLDFSAMTAEAKTMYTSSGGGGVVIITKNADGSYTCSRTPAEIAEMAQTGAVVAGVPVTDSGMIILPLIGISYGIAMFVVTFAEDDNIGTMMCFVGDDAVVVQEDANRIAPMTGASAADGGKPGTVPAPSAGQQDAVLHGDGTWRKVESGGTSVEIDGTLTQAGKAADAKATGEKIGEVSRAIADKADKTLTSADGDSWELSVESGGDVVTHKTSGAVEIVAESLTAATFADKVLTLSGIAGTYGAVIIPDASEISIDVPTNVAENPYFADPAGWQNPSFGWFLLRTAEGYITVHTTNYAEVYKVSADLKTWTSVGGAVTNVAQNTMRVVLDNGTATVYSDDVVTYSVDGITGIGYAASSVKVQTIYAMKVIHQQFGESEADLSEVNNRIDELDDRKMDKILTSPDGTKWVLSVSDDGVLTVAKYTGESIPATGITLNPTVLLFEDSANKMITATLTPVDSTDTIVWESSNDGVATVSGGKVTPIANGTATITATAGSVSASCEVSVNIAAGEATTYKITRNITNAVGFDDSETIGEGSELLECYVSDDECTMDGATATITMNGDDITESAWDNGVVNIAEVTGDVVITLDAVKIQYVVPTADELTLQTYTGGLLFIKGYTGTATAIEFPMEITYEDVTYTVADNTLRLYQFKNNTVKHIKVPTGMTSYGNNYAVVDTNGKSVLRTVKGIAPSKWYNSPNCEKVPDFSEATNLTSIAEYFYNTGIRTAQGVRYANTITNMTQTYWNCKSLIDGGTIPAHVENIGWLFYGASALRRVRIESKASISKDMFQGNSTDLHIELYSDSGLWNYVKSQTTKVGKRSYTFIDGVELDRVICFGDSLTDGSYPVTLNSLTPSNVLVSYEAQGGYKSNQIYADKMLVDPASRYLKSAVIVIWHGTNGYGTDGYDGITAKMVAALEGNQRYLLIPPTAQGAGDEVYESWVATYGAEHVMSVGDWFANNGYTVADYQTDGTHFTAEGYQLIAQAIYDKLIASGFVTAAE